MEDLYELLGVGRGASQAEIKSAYRKKAKKYHPDLNPGDEEAQEYFKKVNVAYEVLKDENKRSQYDMYGDSIFEGGAGGSYSSGFEDLFGSIFDDLFTGGFQGFSGAAQKNNRPQKGQDVEVLVDLTFNEAVFGTKKKISVRRREECSRCHGEGVEEGSEKVTCPRCGGSGQIQNNQSTAFGSFIRLETCPKCHGKGVYIENPCKNCNGSGYEVKSRTISVTIPAGVDDGNIMRVAGEGHIGKNGGANGDLYLRFKVEDHEFFNRQGLDIHYDLPIRFTQAVLGDEIDVPNLEGIEKFDLPKGTQSGEVFKLKNEGVKDPNSDKKGDIYFKVKIVTPQKITDDQKDLLKKFDQIDGESTKEQKGFINKIKELFS